jgi:hypothetical protein
MNTHPITWAIESIDTARLNLIDTVFHLRRKTHRPLQDRILDLVERLAEVNDECGRIVAAAQRPAPKKSKAK